MQLLKDSFRDLLPIILVILFFQLAIIQHVPDGWMTTVIGMVIVGFGLAVFLLGLEMGIFPIGEKLAHDFASHKQRYLVLVFGFLLGFGTTIAEPALTVIAHEAERISAGRIDAFLLRIVVALSVGLAIVIGVFRIIKGHPIHYYIIAGYVLVVGTTFFSPNEIVGLAYDLGGVTTSTVTVPLVAALGIGLATMIKGRSPILDGFGLIAFASLTPMIFVQIYGIFVYNFIEAKEIATTVAHVAVAENFKFSLSVILEGLVGVVRDVLPILAIILFFQYIVLKKKIANIKTVFIGFGLVILGLYAFILGLEMGLFRLGATMALQLTQRDSVTIIYIFAFTIGFATTMAEPALMAIAKKSKEISDGRINDFILRFFVAVGVAIGIAIGAFRIIDGGHLHYYIMVGYIFVIVLTFFAPRYVIPIAYDSGGVTTSTVTVPLVAALGIGLASNIPGRDPFVDGFGLIAFASLFPILTVMLYGIVAQKLELRQDGQYLHKQGMDRLGDGRFATVLLDGDSSRVRSISLDFSAVVAIAPKERKDDILKAARDGGATGVSILRVEGMGLHEMESLYRRPNRDDDLALLFLVPRKIVDDVIKSLTLQVDVLESSGGMLFAFPLSHMKGISIQEEIIKRTKKQKNK